MSRIEELNLDNLDLSNKASELLEKIEIKMESFYHLKKALNPNVVGVSMQLEDGGLQVEPITEKIIDEEKLTYTQEKELIDKHRAEYELPDLEVSGVYIGDIVDNFYDELADKDKNFTFLNISYLNDELKIKVTYNIERGF